MVADCESNESTIGETAACKGKSLIIPPPLEGDHRVGITAVSGPVPPGILQAGLSFLRHSGFLVVEGETVRNRWRGYLAGTDQERAEDLNRMLNDPDIPCVIFARGGYGVMRILDRIDIGGLRSSPKLLLGMSDLTALQLSLLNRIGLVTFSGPMPAGLLGQGPDPATEASLMAALTKPLPGRELIPEGFEGVCAARGGAAAGVLVAGCLSMITAILGTPHFPDLTGAVLVVEDVNEPLYRIDRMLTQLKLAGVIDRLSGMVVGHMLGPRGKDLAEPVGEIVLEVTETTSIPVLTGFPHGHVLPTMTLPVGVPVRLDADPPSLRVDL